MTNARRRTVPFAPFEKLFAELGWTHLAVPGSHHLFTEPGTTFGVMLPLAQRGRISAHYVAVVGVTLDQLGWMARGEAERRLDATARKGTASPSRRRGVAVAP
jgi:predicted RNA binding protein YcfA (HicA-like mRNA interferase family)